MCLKNVIQVHLAVTAIIVGCRRAPGGQPPLHLRLRNPQFQQSRGNIEFDHIAIPDDGKRPAHRRLRRDVKDHRPVSRAAHAGVAQAHHIFHARLQQFRRKGHVTPLGHSWSALGTRVLEHQHAALVHIQIRVVHALHKIVIVLKHHGAPLVLEELGRGGRLLDHGSMRRQIPLENGGASFALERLVQRLDDLAVETRGWSDVFADGLSRHRHGVQVQKRTQFLHDRGQSARVEHILHQESSRRPDVGDEGGGAGDFVEFFEWQVEAYPARDGHQMDDGVGRSADRHVDADGVLEGLAREDARGAQALPRHLDRAPAALLGCGQTPRVCRGDVRAAAQRHAQGFGQAGHGGRRAHHHAVARAARDAAFDLAPLFLAQPPRALLAPVAARVGARADGRAAIHAPQHGPARHHDGRNVRARRAHQLRGRCLVATGEQHDGVERVSADALLHVDRHQVAIEHGGGLHQHFPE